MSKQNEFKPYEWPAITWAKARRQETNDYGMPYLNSKDRVAVAASQAQRVAQKEGATFDGIQQAVSSVVAWTSLETMQAKADAPIGESSPAEREILRNLPTTIVYEIAAHAAREAFRVGARQGLQMNAPIVRTPAPEPVKKNKLKKPVKPKP
jgi:hypothetical protein